MWRRPAACKPHLDGEGVPRIFPRQTDRRVAQASAGPFVYRKYYFGKLEMRKMDYSIIRLKDKPADKEKAAQWFHEKWGIPLDAYLQSMEDCLSGDGVVPQWYLAMAGDRIIGGLGVIENDFHDRKDLTPNVCAVYTEEDCRGYGVAGTLLHHVCADMKENGIDTLYLVTALTTFYERYGWSFLCMVHGESGVTRMYFHREGDCRGDNET